MKPTPDLSVLLPDRAAIRARRAALTGVLRPDRPRRRRGARALVAVAALFVVGGGAAWATGVFSAEDVDPDAGVACYDRAALHANVTGFVAAADPVEKCERFWRQGIVRLDDTTPPPLVACTEENGGIAVFPGGPATCVRLGLVPLPSDYAPIGTARARAFAALHFMRGIPAATSACPAPRRQADAARAKLADRYPDVEVAIEGEDPCGGGYALAGDRIVVVTVSEKRGRANFAARKRRLAQAGAEAAGR